MGLIKSSQEVERMREAGRVVAAVLKRMQELVAPGISTLELNDEAEKIILSFSAKPSFKNYNGFKFATCMSVEDVVVHGFPSQRKLLDGEIVSIDVGACLNGYHSDAARTFPVGSINAEKLRLIETTQQCFFEGCKFLRAGYRLGDVGAAIQGYAESRGYGVVRTMASHGIGKRLHEDPTVVNYGRSGTGMALAAGMAIALEPMINMGTYEVFIDHIDKWSCKTKDGLPSAHYENTVIVTDGEPEILTLY